ncbi:hypothetical protein EELLY_v1c07560 [Entomoplasma ellychniae]|uniref:Uncharacterized protein n=1 Tax=Entomoplasma ellychniae TaxID=2114 RepID=A0A8E2QY91_9MOLU|nr:hypothetical protein [Entomoplasma ellychniae]PPE05068.1 hypothetical protein EELLY_v1c07560 [Entomoplasma ellychniae]
MNKDMYNIEKFSDDEKYKFFKELKPVVLFAIKRAYNKFDSIPLEIEDMEYYAWEAYNDLIKIYYKRKMRKSFTSCLVDAVYWKTLNICSKYVNNKFKIVNNCMRNASLLNDDYHLNINYHDENQTELIDNVGWNDLLDKYFSKFKTDLERRIFNEHVNGTHLTKIAKQEDISISKTKSTLQKIIIDLKEVINSKVF